jgi:invasion protein IalB
MTALDIHVDGAGNTNNQNCRRNHCHANGKPARGQIEFRGERPLVLAEEREVKENMKLNNSIASRTLVPLALALAGSLAATAAFAQQPAPKAAPAAPAAKGAAPAAAAPGDGKPAPAWVKLCEKGTFTGKDKDGKDVKQEHSICLTHHERIDAQSGIVLVSAAVRQVDEGKNPLLMVMLPLGMAIPAGMQVGVYPKDMWEKIQKNEKVDDTKLTPIKIPYILCHSAGCTGEIDATPEMIESFKSNGGIIVYAVSGSGQPVAFPIPLVGFDTALAGPAADNQEYAKQRTALMKQIAENQQKAIEEYRKQTEELQKTQGRLSPGAAAAPAPGTAPPAKK